jgi:hypothetical protein
VSGITVFKAVRVSVVLVSVALVLGGLAACGSSGDNATSSGSSVSSSSGNGSGGGDAVAWVGEHPITRATLNHWMSTMVGGDINEISGQTSPARLVSDPPNYHVCVAALATAVARWTPSRPKPSAAFLRTKCKELNEVIKLQALKYLVASQQSIELAADQGVTVSDEEVKQWFERKKARQFSTDAEFRQYLADRRWTLGDDLYLVRQNLISNKLRQKATTDTRSVAQFEQSEKDWIAKTSCLSGYVVKGCKEYSATQKTSTRPPDMVLEELIPRGTPVRKQPQE